MNDDKLKKIHNQRIYFFDKNYSALSFIKLLIFLNSNYNKNQDKIYYTIGKVKDKNDGFKYVIYNNYYEVFKTSSKNTFKKYIQHLKSERIKLKYKDYYIEFNRNLRYIDIGRICDSAKIRLRLYKVKKPHYYNLEPIKEQNDITLRSLLTVINHDKFKDGGFNNFMEDYSSLINSKGMIVDISCVKAFMSPTIKRSFDYSRDVNYDRMFLKMCFNICKNMDDKYRYTKFSIPPLQIKIQQNCIVIKLFKTLVDREREIHKHSSITKYYITDINELSDKTINLICYLMTKYPGSIGMRNAISKVALDDSES